MGSIRLTQVILFIATFLPFLAQAAVIPRGDDWKQLKCRPISPVGGKTTTTVPVVTTTTTKAVTTTTKKATETTTTTKKDETTTTTKDETTTTTTKDETTTTTTTKDVTTTTTTKDETTTTTTTKPAETTTTTTTTKDATTTTTGSTTTTTTASPTPKYDHTSCAILNNGPAVIQVTDSAGKTYKAFTSGFDGGLFMAEGSTYAGAYAIKNGYLIDADIYEDNQLLAPATIDPAAVNPQVYFESEGYRQQNGLTGDKEVVVTVGADCVIGLSYGGKTVINFEKNDNRISLGTAVPDGGVSLTLKFVQGSR